MADETIRYLFDIEPSPKPNRNREYYLANKERIRAKGKIRYKQKRDQLLAQNKLWQKNNKEKFRATAKRWREANKDRLREKGRIANRRWAKQNPERVKELRYRTRDKLRSDVLYAYGGKCACCGEQTRQFLSIDHINGGGRTHRKQINALTAQAFYTWLRKNKYPPGFQVLCHNCNCAKGYYGVCPHENAAGKST